MSGFLTTCRFAMAAMVLAVALLACGDSEGPEPTPDPGPEPTPSAENPMSNPRADLAFEAYNGAFLVEDGSLRYYRERLGSDDKDYYWCQALDILGAEDTYMRTQTAAHKALVRDLLLTFMEQNRGGGGLTDWNWNDFNDDLLWAAQAFVRGYRITGETSFLSQAKYAFDRLYARGWDDKYFGGGIWWAVWTVDNPKFGSGGNYTDVAKSGLSNNPAVTTACYLYELGGDPGYLVKAIEIYDWIRRTLYVDSGVNAGGVDENISPRSPDNPTEGRLTGSYNVYNVGAFVEAANCLHRLTGEVFYYDDAKRSIDFVIGRCTENGVMTHSGKTDGTWQSEFARGMGDFVRDNNAWDEYYGFMKANADAAWNTRNTSLDVGGCDWTNASSPNYRRAVTDIGTVIMQQVTPASNPALREGVYYRVVPKTDRQDALLSRDFRVESAGQGYYRILSQDGKCLALSGTNIVLDDRDDDDGQLWKLRYNYNGYHTVMPKTRPMTTLARSGDGYVVSKIGDRDTERWIFEEQ